MAQLRKTKNFTPNNCPVTHCMNKIGGKWKPVILYQIRKDRNRFTAILKSIPDISKQMLVNQLRELEEDDVIERTVFAEVPPRVEYTISRYGQTLLPIIDSMSAWGLKDMKKYKMPIHCGKGD